jgi:hypothetical protein
MYVNAAINCAYGFNGIDKTNSIFGTYTNQQNGIESERQAIVAALCRPAARA